MRELNVAKLPEYVETTAVVSEWSTVRIKHNAYSVPSRLIGHELSVRIYEGRIEAFFDNQSAPVLSCERLLGRNGRRIDYRHIIWSLVRKPGGFERYVYREEMFPSLTFRRAYDAIQSPHQSTKGDLEYLRVLHLAATTLQSDVEASLELLLDEGDKVTCEKVKSIMGRAVTPTVPELSTQEVDLKTYDCLLSEVGT